MVFKFIDIAIHISTLKPSIFLFNLHIKYLYMKNISFLFAVVISIFISACSSQNEGYAPSLSQPQVPVTGTPLALTNLTAVPGNARVDLTWSDTNPTATTNTYTVQRSLTSGGAYSDVTGCVAISILSCADTSVTNGMTYYYIVRASNSVGTSPNSNEVSARPTNPALNPPGTITYSVSAPVYTVNTAITNNTPSVVGGGAITSWSISPNLTTTTGLNFNTSTGVISGTPTIVSSPGQSYTVTATNADGTSTVNITIRVNSSVAAPTISYSGTYTYLAGQTLTTPITPTLGGGAPTSCTASPALPTGFVLNSTTCAISGTPTATASQQNFAITASNSGGSASALVNIGVLPGGPTNISITGVANFTTSTCALFNLTSRDSFGNASNLSNATTFNLSGTGGAFYSDSACATSISNLNIASNSSSSVFYYQKTTSGSASLTATLSSPTNPALGSATRNVNVAVSTPAKYGLTVPATGTTVSCNSVSVNVMDSSDNLVNATSALTVSLSGTASAVFYSDANCTTGISSLSIASGSNSTSAYMRKTSTGTSTLTASSTGMASGSGTITISVAPALRITFSAVAASPFAATTCQAYTLQTRDALNNNASSVTADTVVNLSGVSDGSFYSSSTCASGSEITTTTILNNTSSKVIYYSKPTATAVVPGSNISLTASVSGWSPDVSTSVSVSSGSPKNLGTANTAVGIAISSASNVATASKCLLTTVRVQDELNVLVPISKVTSNITATLSGGGAGAQFWSNATCTVATSTVTILANNNTGNFYYSSSTTTPTTAMTWTNGGLSGSGGSRNVTVSNGVPSRLTWTTVPTNYNANTCQTYSFNVRDANTVTAIGANVATATTFQLSDNSDGQFFSAAGCSGLITSIDVAANAQAATFYYKKSTATPPAATISVALQSPTNPPITTLSQSVNVTLPADNILITAVPSTGLIATQSCSALTLQSRNGTTPVNVTTNSTFTLSGTNGASFYLDSGCTAQASPSSRTILANTNSISGLYVKTANTGNVTISGTGPLTVNNLILVYSAPAPTLLALSGPNVLNAGTSCGSYTVTTQDSGGVPRNVSSNATITAASTGAAAVQFYSNSACTTALPSNQVTVSSGNNNTTFYVRGNAAGSAQVQVSAAGLSSDSYGVTVK